MNCPKCLTKIPGVINNLIGEVECPLCHSTYRLNEQGNILNKVQGGIK